MGVPPPMRLPPQPAQWNFPSVPQVQHIDESPVEVVGVPHIVVSVAGADASTVAAAALPEPGSVVVVPPEPLPLLAGALVPPPVAQKAPFVVAVPGSFGAGVVPLLGVAEPPVVPPPLPVFIAPAVAP